MKRIFVAISIILILLSSCVPDSAEEKLDTVAFSIDDRTGSNASLFSLDIRSIDTANFNYSTAITSIDNKILVDMPVGKYEIIVNLYDENSMFLDQNSFIEIINVQTSNISLMLDETGKGTKDNPFMISSEEDFSFLASCHVSENTYFALSNDIELDSRIFYPGSYSFNLDGRGHRISVTGPEIPIGSDYTPYGIFYSLENASISNLDFYTQGFKAFACFVAKEGNVSFENVDAYGNMNGADSNVGPYIIFIGSQSTLSMTDCNNYADIIDNQGGYHYGAAFVGGYLQYDTKSVSFERCNNYGDLLFGENAAMLIGNNTNLEQYTSTLKVVDCYNYGSIQGVQNAGFKSWMDTGGLEKVNKGEGFIGLLDNSLIKKFTVEDNGSLTFESTVDEDEDYTISYLCSLYFSYDGQGSRTISYPVSPEEGRLPVSAVDVKVCNKKNGEVFLKEGVYKLAVDPFAYEFEEGPVKIGELTYHVVIKEGDRIVAMKSTN